VTEPGYDATGYRMNVRPHLGVGWQTIADQVHQEVTMQIRLFCLRLPIKRRIHYSEVAHVSVMSRVSWWWAPTERWESWMQSPRSVTEMPTKGWRYDILMTLRGGKTIKIETATSIAVANEMERQLRQTIGLAEVH
jgi:hypothetical protein